MHVIKIYFTIGARCTSILTIQDSCEECGLAKSQIDDSHEQIKMSKQPKTCQAEQDVVQTTCEQYSTLLHRHHHNRKNDRRSSGGTLRQKLNLIDLWHLTFDI